MSEIKVPGRPQLFFLPLDYSDDNEYVKVIIKKRKKKPNILLFVFGFFETGSHCIALAVLEFTM